MRKKLGFGIACCLMVFNVILAQNRNDSSILSPKNTSNKNISYSAGLFVSTDAEGFYVAPTIKGELRYQIIGKFSVVGFGHYFKARFKDGLDKGNFKLLSFGLVPQMHLGRENRKGMYIGLGICHQSLTDKFNVGSTVGDEKRNYFTAAFMLGHLFPAEKNKVQFALELFTTGPYSESQEMSSYTEILTQLSFGGKIIF